MKTETFEFTGHNRTVLPVYIWMPDGEVRAVLQITHGMTEHMGRYETFAENLSHKGIAVAGFDRQKSVDPRLLPQRPHCPALPVADEAGHKRVQWSA